jgi:uncharacterized membrane protein YdjX (TVP38/TMEM64 family)
MSMNWKDYLIGAGIGAILPTAIYFVAGLDVALFVGGPCILGGMFWGLVQSLKEPVSIG